MQKVRLGIIGTGVIGKKHLEAAVNMPCIHVAGITDLSEQSAREAAGKFGVDKVHVNAGAMLADPDIDAVVLSIPAVSRTELALKAMCVGKHVLIEKPIGMTVAEVQRLIEAKAESKQDLIIGCCTSRFRFYESAGVLSEFIASDVLGELRMLRIRGVVTAGEAPTAPPPVWRLNRAMNGGGILMNWGCYDLDYMLGLTGWKLIPQRLFAHTWPVSPHLAARVALGSDAETHVSALISCEGGVVISLERAEFTASRSDEIYEIIGTHGSLKFKMLPGEGKEILYTNTDPVRGTNETVLWSGNEQWEMVHSEPVRDFAMAIIEGRDPKTTLEQALVIQKITDAIYVSSETNSCVDIDS